MNVPADTFFNLSIALAIGLLIGVERGWTGRDAREGGRVAGIRTYGLIGLLGGVTALVARELGELFMPLAFIAVAGVLVGVYCVNRKQVSDIGITSLVAALLTFVFGSLAAVGETTIAAAFAVLTTLLLGLKPVLHRWVRRIEARELHAGLKLLLISVVLLPVLPDQGYGPWQALNPYRIWLMVVLIAAISFSGYLAIKVAGPTRGAVFTGLFAGLASSTALTLQFSRATRESPAMAPLYATGILVACGTMLPRILVLVSLINPTLLPMLALPAAVMAGVIAVPALLYLFRADRHPARTTDMTLTNPLELSMAMWFGLLIAAIFLLGKAMEHWLGDTGILMLAAASGLTDVDAITLSLSEMSRADLPAGTVVTGILIALIVNSLVKGLMATFIGGWQLGLRVGLPLLLACASGGALLP